MIVIEPTPIMRGTSDLDSPIYVNALFIQNVHEMSMKK